MRIVRPGIARFSLTATLLFACAPAAAAPQQAGPDTGGRRTMQAARLADGETITLDGRLDEPIWSRTIPAGDFIQIDPDNGRPATEKTEVRIAFNADALYIGITCYDSDPDGWIGYQRRRDEGLPSDDKVRWTIDTFLDARSGYFFEMNPIGGMSDALMGINGGAARGTGSGMPAHDAARSAGCWKSSCRSGPSTSTRTARPGASISSGPSSGRTR